MSAFEVAGVVLGSLPPMLVAMRTYMFLLGKWGHLGTTSELNNSFAQLSADRGTLLFVCEQLLRAIVRERDIDPELRNPIGPLWQAKKSNDKIRRVLGKSYAAFESTVFEIKEAIDSMAEQLQVDISRDGKVSPPRFMFN